MSTLATPADDHAVAAAQPAPAAVTARLTYAIRGSAKPVTYTTALTGSEPHYVGAYVPRKMAVENGRPEAARFTLDRNGFAFRRHASAVQDFHDDAELAAVYDPEIEALLKEVTGAARVVIFDRTRRTDGPVEDGFRPPARYVHNDYTEKSGAQRVRDLLAEHELEALSGQRIAQVNVWRPSRGPVLRAPLGLIDAATVAPGDLVATDLVYPDRTGEIYHVAHSPAHRWVYFPRMTPEEVLVIKGYDSAEDGRARFTPHAAFDDPTTPADAPPRESIEVRTLLFFDARQ